MTKHDSSYRVYRKKFTVFARKNNKWEEVDIDPAKALHLMKQGCKFKITAN